MNAMPTDQAINEVVSGALAAALLAVAALTVVRVTAHIRKQTCLHRHRANRRFAAGYRAGFRAAHSPGSRTTDRALPRNGTPVVRPIRRPTRVIPTSRVGRFHVGDGRDDR